MSAHNILKTLAEADWVIQDPGASGAIPRDKTGIVNIVTAAAETRTLAAPVKEGIELALNMVTDGGDCVITVASAIDDVGTTTITLDDAGDYVLLRSFTFGTTFRWRVVTFPSLSGLLGLTASAAELNTMDGILATTAELNRAADVSTRIVNATASTLTVTEAAHDGKTIVLDLAAGIAVTLPAASAGLKFRFIVKATFTGAATIKSVTGADIMIGHALMGNDSDNTVVEFRSIAASTNDTIDMLGTANSTGGIAGQVITIEGLAANLWFVEIRGDAAGTEATPFANTVA